MENISTRSPLMTRMAAGSTSGSTAAADTVIAVVRLAVQPAGTKAEGHVDERNQDGVSDMDCLADDGFDFDHFSETFKNLL